MDELSRRTDASPAALAAVHRIAAGAGFRLEAVPTLDPAAAGIGKARGKAMLADLVGRLAELQGRFYADGRRSLLLVLQAMDAGGKDGTIAHVLSGVNPQGLTTVSFKAPTADEVAHDFLWRIQQHVPARGMWGVFNRSHYEDVLAARVHPEFLAPQRLLAGPDDDPGFWDGRLADIRSFEAYLARQGTCVVKVFLHLGQDEQRKRLLARLDDPQKLWKFDPGDLRERALWPAYMAAYQDAIAATATAEAPWYVVPADQKWYARLAVASILVATLEALDLRDPVPTPAQRAGMAEARRQLDG